MIAIIGVAIGCAFAIGSLLALPRVLRADRHRKQNYHGRELIATGGVALLMPLIACGLLSLAADDAKVGLTMAGAGLAMAGLGYVDDVYGDRHAGGLIGHIRAFARGTVTTGLLKAGGGAIAGLGAAAILGWRGLWGIAAGAVVALASNMANLFDLRPGRTIKIWAPVAVWVSVDLGGGGRVVLAALLGACAAFLVWELSERVMLGDTGAGLLGAVLGVGLVERSSHAGVLIALGVLLGLTLVSEVASFSRIIDAVPPLRMLDRLGRRSE